MNYLSILAAIVVSFTSQEPVSIKKMVVFEDGAPAKAVVLDTPMTIGSKAAEYTFDLANAGKGFSIALYEADATKADGIGRACSFVYCKGPKDAKLELKKNGERYDVKARGYYKSLFVDAGYSLSNYYTPAQFNWITTLGLEDDYEYLQVGKTDSVKFCAIQNGVMVGAPTSEIDWKDDNGALLYPDGEPRFRMIYSNGGKSSLHGSSLGEKGRKQIHDYYEKGGSYVGTCAGAFLGCANGSKGNRYNNPDPKRNSSYGLYPGTLMSTAVPINIKTYPSVYTAMDLTPRCKEIGEHFGYHFEDTIEQVRHHGGGYMKPGEEEQFPGVEILMRYAYTQKHLEDSCSYTDQNRLTYAMHGKGTKVGPRKSIDGKIATFAWKANDASGRACITGSHPEKEPAGSTKHKFISMMAQYAMEGNGDTDIKSELTVGKAYSDPTGVGDLQYHHFRFVADKEMHNVRIILDSKTKADLYLTLRNGDFAWLSDADYMVCSEGGKKILTVSTLPAGTWYIGVYCATTVTATVEKEKKNFDYFYYVDKFGVLNGVKYKLTVK